ncbi:hypothetical protein ACTGXQ_13155, partial [Streptococcus suis]
MLRPLLVAALIGLPAALSAQVAGSPGSAEQAQSGQPQQRVRGVPLPRGEKCPQSSSTEIVVCSTLDQPYRIPKQFRDSGPIPA